MATIAYGKILERAIERSTDDTDSIVINLTKKRQAFDITGWTADLTVNTAADGTGGDNVFEASGVVFGDPLNAQIAIDMSGFSLPKGPYFYDIRLIDAAGRGRESLAGPFDVFQRIVKNV